MLEYIPIPTLRDLADIIFLTFVAYYLYVWFKGTRALRLIIGLIVLGGVYSLAKLWGLFLTTWVFQILWQVLVILLLILFQSEIRQVLEKINLLRYLKSRKGPSGKELAKQIADISFELAKEQTGALIVIVRNEDPREFIQAGHPIMALPEPNLIKSIFNHHSPSHDGAIILSQGKITHMGCILPLSKNENIPENFGTRHRAALGLSERTDAISIVVSEERMEISTAVEGNLALWKDPEKLAGKLRELVNAPEPVRVTFSGFIKGAFAEKWRVKLGALAVVTLAWLVIANPQEIKTTVSVPLKYTELSEGLVIDEVSEKTVRMVFSGNRYSIRRLKEREIRIPVNLSYLPEGTHQILISLRDINLPPGISIDQSSNRRVTVVIRPSDSENLHNRAYSE